MIYKVKNLSFKYPNSNMILNNISLEIDKGNLYTILGKNGIGKTTLFNCLLHFNDNYEGEILLNNRNIKSLKEKDIAKIVSFVPQNSNCTFDYTVFEYVLMGTASNISLFSSPSKKEEEAVKHALEELSIIKLSNKKFKELSGGEQQLVLIARSIVNNPQLIFFDEPTSHLDYENQIKVLRTIKSLNNKGYTIVLTTHDPNQAFLLNDKVILIDNKGSIIEGDAKITLTEDNLKNIFGNELNIRYLNDLERNIVLYPTL